MKIVEQTKVEDSYVIRVGNFYLKEYTLRPTEFDSTITLVSYSEYAKVFVFGTDEEDAKNNEEMKKTILKLLERTDGTLILTRTKTNVEKRVKEVDSFVDLYKE